MKTRVTALMERDTVVAYNAQMLRADGWRAVNSRTLGQFGTLKEAQEAAKDASLLMSEIMICEFEDGKLISGTETV